MTGLQWAIGLLGAYAGVLVWMKRIALGPPTLRFLGEQASQGGP